MKKNEQPMSVQRNVCNKDFIIDSKVSFKILCHENHCSVSRTNNFDSKHATNKFVFGDVHTVQMNIIRGKGIGVKQTASLVQCVHVTKVITCSKRVPNGAVNCFSLTPWGERRQLFVQ